MSNLRLQSHILVPTLALVGALSVCVFLVGQALELPQVKLAVKTIPVLALAAWVWLAGAERKIVLGLVFGAAGDLFLALPGMFLPGMIAFALGHALYVWAFWQWAPRWNFWLALPIVMYLAFALRLMLPGTDTLTIPVILYMSVIGAMIWRATAVACSEGIDLHARWYALAGALLFAFSDTLIGINRFATPLPGVAYPIILTYWAGQLFIAASSVKHQHCRIHTQPA